MRSPLRAAVTLPRNGSTLHGKQFLDVVVSDLFDVTKVDYVLSGPGLEGASLRRRLSDQLWLDRRMEHLDSAQRKVHDRGESQ